MRRSGRTTNIAEDIVRRLISGEPVVIAHDHTDYSHTPNSVRDFIESVQKHYIHVTGECHGRLNAQEASHMTTEFAASRPSDWRDRDISFRSQRFDTFRILLVTFRLDR